MAIFNTPTYPVADKAPSFKTTVKNFSGGDAGVVAGAAAVSAPVGYLAGLRTRTSRPALWAAGLVGAGAGFCLAYQRSAGRLMGFLPPSGGGGGKQ